ncbi:MAG TPA: transporter associated domain-containing protein, partial [Trueperaceae bacterium]|nr:transporter associated domain-containing protein [Trueperaceae bacterium]
RTDLVMAETANVRSAYEWARQAGDRPDVVPEGAGYQTLGGLMADRLGRVPQAGDETSWQGYQLVIEAMEGLRVGWVDVKRVAAEEPEWE